MKCTSGVVAGVMLVLLAAPFPSFAESPAAPEAGAPYVQVPVALDVRGLNGSHYTSDVTIASLGALPSDIELTFLSTLPTPAVFGPYLLGTTLLPGRQAYLLNVIGTMRTLGAALPDDGTSIVGTLLVRLPSGDTTAPFVASRVATPNPSGAGSFGTFSVGVPVGAGSTGTTSLFGLRENDAYRTNVAVVHAGGTSIAAIGLQLQVYDGVAGTPVGNPIAITLQPGQWQQIPSILAAFGLSNGWVRITQTAGTNRYIAYAVVNDGGVIGGGTSDGSWFDTNASEGILPIVLSSGPYRTELVFARPTGGVTGTFVNLQYLGADALGAAPIGGFVHFDMGTNTQRIIPDAITFLRENGLAIPTDGPQGGTLRVTGAVAYARVYSPNPDPVVGGTFGVAFPAVAVSAQATTEAWIYALRQDALVRSNVAVANTASNGSAQALFTLDLYDGVTGQIKRTLNRYLTGGQWYQWDAPFAAVNVRQGFARVRCTPPSGVPACSFSTYGVVNDGQAAGQGTSDGSYVGMIRVQ